LGNIEEIKLFLTQENRGFEEKLSFRTLILLGATFSMGLLIEKTKTAVGIMVERAYNILKEK